MNSTRVKIITGFAAFVVSLLCLNGLEMSGLITESKTVDSFQIKTHSQPDSVETKTVYEKVIYTCQISNEEVPAVQIAEVKDINGNVLGVSARVDRREDIHLTVEGSKPEWDFSAISAQSGRNLIEVKYDPKKQNGGYDWLLTLEGENTNFQRRVKNCSEISAE